MSNFSCFNNYNYDYNALVNKPCLNGYTLFGGNVNVSDLKLQRCLIMGNGLCLVNCGECDCLYQIPETELNEASCLPVSNCTLTACYKDLCNNIDSVSEKADNYCANLVAYIDNTCTCLCNNIDSVSEKADNYCANLVAYIDNTCTCLCNNIIEKYASLTAMINNTPVPVAGKSIYVENTQSGYEINVTSDTVLDATSENPVMNCALNEHFNALTEDYTAKVTELTNCLEEHVATLNKLITALDDKINSCSTQLQENIDTKQDTLTAGENIAIFYNEETKETVISAGDSGEAFNVLSIAWEDNSLLAISSGDDYPNMHIVGNNLYTGYDPDIEKIYIQNNELIQEFIE